MYILCALQLSAYENRAEPSGGQVKDSSSEGSNADSGRGSHEESTSLPGGGSLQRWDNMQLTIGKLSIGFGQCLD